MNNQITSLQKEIGNVAALLKQKATQPPSVSQSPAEVTVKDGQQELKFKFEDGKVAATPQAWRWCLRWSWADFIEYCKVHGKQVVLSGEA